METPEAPRERFTGHEMEIDIDPDYKAVYYAGARYYDGLIGKWNSVDPLADKYPSHSPYNYVLGNPLLLVDPDGMDVTIVYDGEEYEYVAGEEYKGDNRNIRQVVILLNGLRDANNDVKKIIDHLVDSSLGHIIQDRHAHRERGIKAIVPHTASIDPEADFGAAEIGFSPFQRIRADGEAHDPAFLLIHELSHVLDSDLGQRNTTIPRRAGAPDGPPENEVEAVYLANTGRTAFGVSPRRTYTGRSIYERDFKRASLNVQRKLNRIDEIRRERERKSETIEQSVFYKHNSASH